MKTFSPAISGEVIHSVSGAKKILLFEKVDSTVATARWINGDPSESTCKRGVEVEFNIRTGKGRDVGMDCRLWSLTIDTARRITGNPDHCFALPRAPKSSKKVSPQKTPPKQLELFGAKC